MTSSIERALADMVAQQAVEQSAADPAVRRGDWRQATVASVDAGTVTTVDGAIARCLEAYSNPAVGDLIRLDTNGTGDSTTPGRLSVAGDPEWVAFTSAWTAATTNPVLGNGLRSGRRVLHGKTCHLSVRIVPGSTTTFGSGNYSFSLPFPSANETVEYTGTARLTAGSTYIGQTYAAANATTFTVTFPTAATPANATNMSPSTPATLASGHILRMSLTYQIA
ncbi:hypothetical protein GCM10011583_66170 [Streptomyces camponoticapitis]|uniref:Uncharacterized protein n=1 Tax=Streptomyces camponoticapitis TaxID=1616125 RepID=A0ABQ2EWZ2_9ACTN|nr:hypothetical protein [Streptomyces camponoticapitis]GGK24861.1 hypothetical protein GCM10011583_66170 [Streptomyces camponoticapitis]